MSTLLIWLYDAMPFVMIGLGILAWGYFTFLLLRRVKRVSDNEDRAIREAIAKYENGNDDH